MAKSRLPILDNFVEPDKWQDFCRQARSTSLELLSHRDRLNAWGNNYQLRIMRRATRFGEI